MVTFCVATKTDENIIQQAGIGGLLHDAGKACVPDEILNKPGKLTQEEFAIMQRHPADGYQLLRASILYRSISCATTTSVITVRAILTRSKAAISAGWHRWRP